MQEAKSADCADAGSDEMATPVLVIGIGNSFRRDDGVGLRVAQQLESEPPPRTTIVECGDGASLLDLWEHAESVYIVDAASSGAAPGTIHRIDARAYEIPAGMMRCSTHNMGVAEAIALGRVLGTLPRRLTIYGIEVEDVSRGVGLSQTVENVVSDAARHIRDESAAMGFSTDS